MIETVGLVSGSRAQDRADRAAVAFARGDLGHWHPSPLELSSNDLGLGRRIPHVRARPRPEHARDVTHLTRRGTHLEQQSVAPGVAPEVGHRSRQRGAKLRSIANEERTSDVVLRQEPFRGPVGHEPGVSMNALAVHRVVVGIDGSGVHAGDGR